VLTPGEAQALAVLRRHPTLARLELPPSDDWSLDATTLMLLMQFLEADQPGAILEFGTGKSTLVFAAHAASQVRLGQPAPQLFAVDHDSRWLELTRQQLEANGLAGYVQLILAPLSVQSFAERSQQAYSFSAEDRRKLAQAGGLDLCLIDGPPGEVGRSGSLPLVAEYLRPGALVLLDDANRPDERQIWKQWQTQYRSAMAQPRILLTPKGLAAARWSGMSSKSRSVRQQS
jgi:predicted O-methyltransferase YrrM